MVYCYQIVLRKIKVRVVFLHLSAPHPHQPDIRVIGVPRANMGYLAGNTHTVNHIHIFADLPFDLIAQNLRCMYTLNFHFGAKMYTRKQALVTSYTITVHPMANILQHENNMSDKAGFQVDLNRKERIFVMNCKNKGELRG